MIITCEECNVRFNLDESILNAAGTKVRCSKCKHIFTAYPPPPPEKVEPVDVSEPTVTEETALEPPDDAETSLAASLGLDSTRTDEAARADMNLDIPDESALEGESARDIPEDMDLDLGLEDGDLDLESEQLNAGEPVDEELDLDALGPDPEETAAFDQFDEAFEIDSGPDVALDDGTGDEGAAAWDEPAAAPDFDDAQEREADDDDVLDTLDFDLDIDEEPSAEDILDDGIEDIDLGEALIDGDTADSGLDALDFDIEGGGVMDSDTDLLEDLDFGEDIAGDGPDGEIEEDLDLDLDFGEAPAAEEETEAAAPEPELDDVLFEDPLADDSAEDLDLDLFVKEDSEAGVRPLADEPELEDALTDDAIEDMDLDLDFIDDAAEEESAAEFDLPPELEETPVEDALDDLDLDLDMDEEPLEAETAEESAPDLETEDISAAGAAPDDDVDGLDLDLDFIDDPADLDLAGEPIDGPADDGELDDGLEDLELDLGIDADETGPSGQDEAPVEKEDLDLTGMDDELEKETDAGEDAADALEDFDLNLDLTDESPAPVEGPDEGGDLGAEFDLSDLESVLDEAQDAEETADRFDDATEPDLELDLGLDKDLEPAGARKDIDEELDFSDIEDLLDENTTEDSEDLATEELEFDLDLDLEEEPLTADQQASELSQTDLYDIDDADAEESVTENLEFALDNQTGGDLDETIVFTPAEQKAAVESAYEPQQKAPPSDRPKAAEPDYAGAQAQQGPAAKKSMGKPVVAVLLLILLGGGLFAGTKVLDGMGIRIPFVSDIVNPLPPDPGNLKISTFAINSRFVDNTTEGKLFVITGQIRNEYPQARRSVKIVGKLYSAGKKQTGTTTVYAGNVIEGPDLAAKKKSEITQLLNKQDVSVDSGQVLPFMVVFDKLPGDLEEFTIEVAGSSK
jgi:pilus assembly protein FimV